MRHLLRWPTLVVLVLIVAALVGENVSTDFARIFIERPITTSIVTGVALLFFTILFVDNVLKDRESTKRRQSVYNVAKALQRRFAAAIEHLIADLRSLQQDEQDRVAAAGRPKQQTRGVEQGQKRRSGLSLFIPEGIWSQLRQTTVLLDRRRRIRGAVEARADSLEQALLIAAPMLGLSEDGEDFLQQCHDLVDRIWRASESMNWASALTALQDLSRDAAMLETKLERIKPP